MSTLRRLAQPVVVLSLIIAGLISGPVLMRVQLASGDMSFLPISVSRLYGRLVQSSCDTFCFRSARYYLLNLHNLPRGVVHISGKIAPVSTSNVGAIELALKGNALGLPPFTPTERFNREFVAAQLSSIAWGGLSSPILSIGDRSMLACYGINFTPVQLINGVTITPSSMLRELISQALAAMSENRAEDMGKLADVFALLNGDNPWGRCGGQGSPDLALSAYAPYWYIDDLTESFLEVKNNLESSIVVAPALMLITGQSVKLSPITIAPLATERILLNSNVEFRLPGKGEPRWGDGSRPNSLLGNAQLTLISPNRNDARAFSAWIFIKNRIENLGLVTPFLNPEDAINTVLEGLWWLPYPNTLAYFALQNTSRVPIEVQMELISDGQVVKTKTFEIKASALQLVNIGDELKPNTPPAVGGVRFRYQTIPGQVLPGHILGRGMLIQEQLGFSSPLMTHESLCRDVPGDFEPELQSPAAYFGALKTLTNETDAILHPHLLLRNTAKRNITVQGIIYGQSCTTLGCNDVALQLNPITLPSESTIHIDLEEQRQASGNKISDGVAGLRLTHDGASTDVIAELINVDQTGDVVWYDAVFNRLFHAPSMQVAISFNLEEGHRTFLVIKNVTDEPQQARIILNYDDGKKSYDVALPEIPAQQVWTVKIKQLRDMGIPDRKGQILPPNVTFGGAIIYSDKRAFIGSDPTFFDGLPIPAKEGARLLLMGQYRGMGTCLAGQPLCWCCFELPDIPRCPGCGQDPRFCGGNGGGDIHEYKESPFRPNRGPCFVNPMNDCLPPDHLAKDIYFAGIEEGEPVRAMEDGVVRGCDSTREHGDKFANLVAIRGNDGFITVYGHVTPFDPTGSFCGGGHVVHQGDIIGFVDKSGRSSSPHVHLIRLTPGSGTADDVRAREKTGAVCPFKVPCQGQDLRSLCQSGNVVMRVTKLGSSAVKQVRNSRACYQL